MSNYLVHYGIPGQKWGNRRFQNEDGSLTPAGERRYYTGDTGSASRAYVSPEYQQEVAYNSQGDVYPNQGVSGGSSNRPHSRIVSTGSGSVGATVNKPSQGTETPYENTMNRYVPKYEVKQKIANVASNIGTGIKNVANKADKALGSVVNVGNQIRADNEYDKSKHYHLEADKAEIMAREKQKEADHYKALAKNATGAAKDKFDQAKMKSEINRDASLFAKKMLNGQYLKQIESAGKYQEKANRTLTETIGDSVEKAKSKVSSLLSKLGKLKF